METESDSGLEIDENLAKEVNSIGNPKKPEQEKQATGTVWFYEHNNSASKLAAIKNLKHLMPGVEFQAFGSTSALNNALKKDRPDILFVGDLYGISDADKKTLTELPREIRVIEPNEQARKDMLSGDYVNLFQDVLAKKQGGVAEEEKESEELLAA